MAKKKNATSHKKKQGREVSASKPADKVQASLNGSGFRQFAAQVLLGIMVVMLALLLIVTPFYRGLFAQTELLFVKVAIFSLLIVWGFFRLARGDNRLGGTPLDICLLVLFLAYFVSFFDAVNKRDALEEVFKTAAYLVVFLVSIDICRYFKMPGKLFKAGAEAGGDAYNGQPGVSFVLNLCLIAAFIVTVASLGAPAGSWDFIGAYAGNRVNSPMAYANTAAAYLMAAYLLTVALLPLARRRIRPLYLATASLILLTFILTFSRGGWLLLPPIAFILVLVAAPPDRLRLLLSMLASLLVVLPFVAIVDQLFRSADPGQAWLPIAAVFFAGGLMDYPISLFLSRSRKIKLAAAGLVAAAGLGFITFYILVPAFTPPRLDNLEAEKPTTQRVEQVVQNVSPGELYTLVIAADADYRQRSGFEEPDYVWAARVIGGVSDFQLTELMYYRGVATDGYEDFEFTFEIPEDAARLEVQIYTRYPGTAVTLRSVTLSGPDREHKLGFMVHRILPQRFYDRAFHYHRDRNMETRFDLFRDAIKVIRDYPLLGAGGGGWEAVYHSYKEWGYNSREVHNHFLQVWIEAGVFGFLAFTGIWISFALAFYRNVFRSREKPYYEWRLWSASFLPVLALGAHSTIDWNFSMAAVGIYLFVLLGAGRSMDRIHWFGKKKKEAGADKGYGFLVGVPAIALGIFMLAYTIMLINGLYAAWRAEDLANRGNIKQAVLEFERATRLDPYRANNYYNLSMLLEERVWRLGNPREAEQMLLNAQRAYELERFNTRYVGHYGRILLNFVDTETGFAYLDATMDYNPYLEAVYHQPVISRLELIEEHTAAGNRLQAERYYREMLAIEQRMIEYTGNSWLLAFPLGRASLVLGDIPTAVEYLERVPRNDPFYREAQADLAAILSPEEDQEPGEECEENSED